MSEFEKKVIADIMAQAGLEKNAKATEDTEIEKEDDFDFSFGWMMLVSLLIFGFMPHFDNTSYQQGKIDAYENILKGFD